MKEQQWHVLKITPDNFQAVIDKKKTCEVRVDDRGYQLNDVLVLREFKEKSFDPSYGVDALYERTRMSDMTDYSGRYAIVLVTSITSVKEVLKMTHDPDAGYAMEAGEEGVREVDVSDKREVVCMSIEPVALTAVLSVDPGCDPATGRPWPDGQAVPG